MGPEKTTSRTRIRGRVNLMPRPNGSRSTCGRLARRRKDVGRQSVPARAQHSASFKAITARQLQALVRRRPSQAGWSYNKPARYRIRARTVPVEDRKTVVKGKSDDHSGR